MQEIIFEQAIKNICLRDSRFEPEAYYFLKDALDYTVSKIASLNQQKQRHISGAELLEGFCQFSIDQFGPMASTLMREWGITESIHIGEMVFHLIEENIFGRQESDQLNDFKGKVNLMKALKTPFLAQNQPMK